MSSRLLVVFDAAFGHPRGLAGRAGGAVMARVNQAQEHRAVADARLRPGEAVLVVGPGPGVGLQAAAAAVAPNGRVVGVEPSATMRAMAQARCAAEIYAGLVEVRAGTAQDTGCADVSVDAAVSVNNVMLWNDRPAGFAELRRVLRPGGRLVVTVHRHALDVSSDQLRAEAESAGLVDVTVQERPRRLLGPAVELSARRPG